MHTPVVLESYQGPTVALATRVPRRLHKAVRRHALDRDQTVQGWVTDALQTHLDRLRSRSAPQPPARGRKVAPPLGRSSNGPV